MWYFPVYEASGKLEKRKIQFCKTYNLANENVIGTFSILLAMALIYGAIVKAVEGDTPALQNDIKVIDAPGTNVRLQEKVHDDYLVVELTTKSHNWWMMKLSGVKGKAITIGFSMDEKGNVGKWTSLQPVYSYADPNKLATFEWFTKDIITGAWRSGNALLPDIQRNGGDGKTPHQSVIPQGSAEEFLSQDGTYWEPWGRITKTQVEAGLNIFRMTTPIFTQNEVWIAMRYPFTYDLLQEFVNALREKHHDTFSIRPIGQSQEKRDLLAIEVKNSRFVQKNPLTVLVYAREHATEPDGSWAIYGMVNAVFIMDPEIRSTC